MTFRLHQHGGKTTLEHALVAAGFERATACTFHSDSLTARIGGAWLSLESAATRWRSPGLGRPGLWKRQAELALFEIPAAVLDEAPEIDGEETETGGMEWLLAWGEASLVGGEPVGWTAPSDADLRALAPAEAWSMQVGPHVRQIDLICNANRSALRLELIAPVSNALSKPRRAWLTRVVDSANDRLRLVRLGFDGASPGTSIVAEIDLTGCPRQWHAALLLQSLAALRHVATELLPTLHSLCDPHVRCDTWEQSFEVSRNSPPQQE